MSKQLAEHLNGPRLTEGMEVENLPVKRLRQRLFNWKSHILFGSPYTFDADLIHVPTYIESLLGFTNWESFAEEWDILWVGLDPRYLKWVVGRHNSPIRELIKPLNIVPLDERTHRMMLTAEQRLWVQELPIPIKEPLPESEEDRAISDSLSGKVVIDEPDEDKAIRLIQDNMDMLQEQLNVLLKKKK